jgi:hypothetical protein
VSEKVLEWKPIAHGLPLLSVWVSIAPVAKADASTWRVKGFVRSSCFSRGLSRMMAMRASRAVRHSGVQWKVTSFFVKLVSGLAMLAKLGMNGRW